jgi:uncharacterized protein (UPF0276 family)
MPRGRLPRSRLPHVIRAPLPHAVRGAGIGLRRDLADATLATSRDLDFVEIIPENFVGRGGAARRVLDAAASRWPILAHGVTASVGGPVPLDPVALQALKALLDHYEVPIYTDHLCYTAIDGLQTHDLLPLPFTDEAVRHAAARIRELSERLERPVAVENVSFYCVMPGSRMPEPDFVRAVVHEAGCGLLLDVNNVWVNAANHGTDAASDLRRLPLDRVWQIHVAGHERQGRRLIDHHGAPASEPVWNLLDAALAAVGDVPVLFEWDTKLPTVDVVLDEADRARAHLARRPEAPRRARAEAAHVAG